MSHEVPIAARRQLAGRLAFGPFELDPAGRTLALRGEPLNVRPRELDILICLIARAGEFVSQHELVAQIWPNTTVSDANLRVQIAALRRTLTDTGDPSADNGPAGDRYILSASGRGYQFCGHVRTVETALPLVVAPAPPRPARPHNLPIRLKPAFGRDLATAELMAGLSRQRLVTVVGPGGIGKTTLSLMTAERVIDHYADGVRFINLAGLSNPSLVTSAVAGCLGIPTGSAGTTAALIRFIADQDILFVLDNCEHLIEAAAELVQEILTRTPRTHFLCTSREPLHIDGEWLLRLGPLDAPPRRTRLTADAATAYPAVRLFVERARLSDSQFQLNDADAATVSELCHRLDGNPLAVELAAACVGMFGIQGLAARLSDSFATLTQGRRTALPRHQTLRATLDWSYDILSPSGQSLLRRLSVFRGDFTLASARAVAGAQATEADFVEWLSELTAKSLLNVDTAQQPVCYRMLFLTRDYAFARLIDGGEFAVVAERHARHFLDLSQASGSAHKALHARMWMDDLRFAFEWAFSPCGDALVGMKLAVETIELGRLMSILAEYADILDRAIDLSDAHPGVDAKLGVRLRIERLSIYLHDQKPMAHSQRLVERAEALACSLQEESGDSTDMFQVYLAKFARGFGSGDAPVMESAVADIRALAVTCGLDQTYQMLLDRVSAQAAHFSGDHARAHLPAMRILTSSPAQVEGRPQLPGDRIDPRITMQIVRARSLWLTGFPAQASEAAQIAVDQCQGIWGHIGCYALAMAVIPVAIWRGDVAAARHGISLLTDQANEALLDYWQRWSRAYTAVVTPFANSTAADPDAVEMRPGILLDHLATFDEARISATAFERASQGLAGWCAPEIFRTQTRHGVASGAISVAEAEDAYLRSLSLAREQGALAWQLRTAMSLGRLWSDQGKARPAVGLLDDVLAQLSEGLGDADIMAARALRANLARM